MPPAPSTSALGATFNPFLFASVTEDAEEPLNVVSVLARLDIDPWQEAAELSNLRGDVAADRLASLLGRCPALILPNPDLGLLAQRLVSLLPRSSGAREPSREGWFGAEISLDPRVIVVAAIIFEIAVVATVGGISSNTPRDLGAAQRTAGSTPPPLPAATISTK